MKPKISEKPNSAHRNIEFSMRLRNLPHWEQGGSVYFITYRTFGGFRLPPEAIICNPVKAKIVATPEDYRWLWSEGFDGVL